MAKGRQLFSAAKLWRVLAGMDVDFEEVRRRYQEDSRRGRPLQEPTKEEVRAVEEFLKCGDFVALKNALHTKNIQVANSAVARVAAHRRSFCRGPDIAKSNRCCGGINDVSR